MTYGTLLIWLAIGGLAGIFAGNVMGAERPFGLAGDVILGILGSIAGGWVLGLMGLGMGGGIIASFVTAFIGALILIWIARKIKKA